MQTAVALQHRPQRPKTIQFQKTMYAESFMDPFQKARDAMKRVVTTGNWEPVSELLETLLEREELRPFKRSPSNFVQLKEVFDDVARVTVFVASLHPPNPSSEVLVDDVAFYDVAEGLMTMYRRLADTVREWLKSSPKLYHRDLLLFYEWEDVLKDFAIMRREKEDFRFSI